MNNFRRYQSPNPVSLTGNPITYKIEYTGGDNPVFDWIGMRVTFTIDGVIYTAEDNKPYTGDKIIEFEIHEVFNKLIRRSVTFDMKGAVYAVHTDGCAQFTVKYGYRRVSDHVWVWEEDSTPAEQQLDNNIYSVINGKMPEYFLDVMNVKNTDFYQQFITPKKFLTWFPGDPEYKTISPLQPERLFFYIHSIEGLSEMSLRVFVQYEFGVATTDNQVFYEANRIFEFAVGLPELVGLETGMGEVLSYYVFLVVKVGDTWEHYSEKRLYRIDWRTFENNTLMFYGNDVGGFDVLWATGRVLKTGGFEGVKRYKDNRYYNGGQTSTRKVKTTKWEVNVGRKSREEIRCTEQIMFNNSVFLPLNGIMIPVDMDDDSTVFEDTNKGFIKVKLAFTLAYKETAFGNANRLQLYTWGEFFNNEFSSEFLI